MITPSILLKRTVLLFLIVVLAGCQAMNRDRAKPGDPAFAPVEPEEMLADEPVDGSIYQNSRNHNMFSDSRALNVGDVLTVELEENTTSSKSSNTNITKDSENDLEAPSVLGQEGLGVGTDVSQEREFDGAAQADQSNQLNGSITVTVVEVMPNDVLRVRGEKWLELTQGEEYVRVAGLIRQQDIGSDNRVNSSRIADARISYGGTGDFDQSNRMGWLTRFFNSEWWPL
ncbi:MAG: flagellar basal body L-ring protein FlgH [Pseudomonadota bacterium]